MKSEINNALRLQIKRSGETILSDKKRKMKNQYIAKTENKACIYRIRLIAYSGIMLMCMILSSCSSSYVHLDINNESKITEYLQGEWSTTLYKPQRDLRLVIQGNTMRLWEKYEEIGTWDSQPQVTQFKLSAPTSGLDGYYKGRMIVFDESNLSLAFRSIDNMYIICDDDWARLAGSPSFGCGGVYFTKSNNK
jgi:hypothetical protein